MKLLFVILFASLIVTAKKSGSESQALKKILLVSVFVILLILFLVKPEYLSNLAWFLDVGRGVDLLIYVALALMFVFIASIYAQLLDLKSKLSYLVSLNASVHNSSTDDLE